jgi:hypothetical protein
MVFPFKDGLTAFHNSQKALLSEFSSLLRIPNTGEIFYGEEGTTLTAKGATSAQGDSGYLGDEMPSWIDETCYSPHRNSCIQRLFML